MGPMNADVHQILSAVWLALLLLVPLVLGIVKYRRGRYGPAQWMLLFGTILLTRFLWRASIPRRLPVNDNAGAVLISNHRSSIDPFFFQIIAGRPVHWMVAKEYCVHPYFRWFLKQCEVIPTNRGGIDAAATRTALRFASNGELVGMFPEGRINTTNDLMLPVRPGAIVVALRSRVPIIPCYIEGAPYKGSAWSPIITPARVRVKIGRPIDLSAYFGREGDSEAVREALMICVREIARMAGRPDFEPQVAGRTWKPAE